MGIYKFYVFMKRMNFVEIAKNMKIILLDQKNYVGNSSMISNFARNFTFSKQPA